MGDVELGLTNMGVAGERTRTLDRTKWVYVVREANTKLRGL